MEWNRYSKGARVDGAFVQDVKSPLHTFLYLAQEPQLRT